MKIKNLEIGTSDFRTLAGKEEGIFIEPVKYYFDRLPANCIKENVAISDKEGEIEIYYLTDEDIKKYNLPHWIRGCNSINEPHPTTLKLLKKDQIRCDKVKVLKIKTILDKHNVTAIDFMKIDTEGHDCIILNNFFDEVDFLPKKIQLENNALSDSDAIKKIISRLAYKGYSLEYSKTDIIATLK